MFKVLHEGCGFTGWCVEVKETKVRPRWKFWKTDLIVEVYELTAPGCWSKERVISSVEHNLKENQYAVVTFKGGIKDGICCEKDQKGE